MRSVPTIVQDRAGLDWNSSIRTEVVEGLFDSKIFDVGGHSEK